MHTRGPWKWWTSNSFKRLKSDDGCGHTCSVLEPYVSSDGHPDIVVNEQDMALIAAAPFLLKVLKDIQSHFQETSDPYPPGWLVRRVNTAIAKAEGK